MQICPYCASEYIIKSKKKNVYFCEDCESSFSEPAVKQGMRLFLSYGHDQNAPLVQKIKDYLSGRGYDVWIDSSQIPAGRDWREQITNGLIGCNGVLSFLSKHSVRDPGVCLDELRIAAYLKRAYIKTVLLENAQEVQPPLMLRNTQWLDMSDWQDVPEDQWDAYFARHMQALEETLDSPEAQNHHDELKMIAGGLAVSDHGVKLQRLLKQTFVGREWLTERVRQWLESDTREPMMIFGVPGSGKSAFAANLMQYDPNVAAAVLFEWDQEQLRSPDRVVCALALKLAEVLPDYRRMLCSLLAEDEEGKRRGSMHGAALFDYLLLHPLRCCIDGERSTAMILFDGLDETSSETARLLLDKAPQFPHWLKCLFTSRCDDAFAARFAPEHTVLLDNAHEQNREDIRRFLAFRLGLSPDSEKARELAEKCEGSFMYANTLCEAIDSGSMSLSDTGGLPRGLNGFYSVFFQRLFPQERAFLAARPLLELLVTRDDVPEDMLWDCLGLDKYGLWELRMQLKSLLTGAESTCESGTRYDFKTLRLVHKSIKDWLTEPTLAGPFFVDETRGYQSLVRCGERLAAEELPVYSTLELIARKDDPSMRQYAHKKALKLCVENNYIKWLILGGQWQKAEKLLLATYDPEKIREQYEDRNYTHYYTYFDRWKWADLFPEAYPVDALVETLKKLVMLPREYVVSSFAHRSFQISLLILRHVMDSGRFREAFFALMGSFYFAGYFKSMASDDGETRDGWDKYYMARDAAVCLKKLDQAGFDVPENVRNNCQNMKLTYIYCNRGLEDSMFYGGTEGHSYYGILCENELLKDVCELTGEVDEAAAALQSRYNTASLQFYLTHSDEEDLQYIRLCAQNRADVRLACDRAESYILRGTSDGYVGRQIMRNTPRRLEFIAALRERNSGGY